ncbi:acyltransferase [Paraburkholderia sp. USG1]|uniref:acyltransferase family protein n=1 Tax=Paraburkholderia sp. USG1 TaxID=2952268 RepID=UPI00285D70EF|nr:acyltransferase [Paraburkholderia sp. USG1]MDR8394968.1 acyltransferase [Paraburkholderia sp. USG1]
MRGAGHSNNFDFIRVVAASLVIWSHQYGLMGRPEPEAFPGFSFGGIGVLIFFSLSGYLVAQSWDRDPSLPRFAAKRALRIFPGLICVTLLMAFLMGPKVSTLDHADYFASRDVWHFIVRTIGLWDMPDHLPGVFVNNHVGTVNSSLWTIPVELKWYGFLAFLGLFGVLRTRFVLPAMVLALAFCRFILPMPLTHHVLLEFGLCFLSGSMMHACRADLQRYANWIKPGIAAAAVVFWLLRMEYLAIVIALPFVVVTLGSMSSPVLRRFGRFGDLSYGLYIYAFPIQQTIIHSSHNTQPLWLNLIASAAAISALAFLSWHLIEQPANGLKRYLKRDRSKVSVSPHADPAHNH